jgi:hypothetical protein
MAVEEYLLSETDPKWNIALHKPIISMQIGTSFKGLPFNIYDICIKSQRALRLTKLLR